MKKLGAKKIRRLTKSQLCIIFDCIRADGTADGRKLKNEYITTDFINNTLKTDINSYRKIKKFSIKDTQTIINYFQIDKEELNQFL